MRALVLILAVSISTILRSSAGELEMTAYFAESEKVETATSGVSHVPVYLVIRNVGSRALRLPSCDYLSLPRKLGCSQSYIKGRLEIFIVFGFDRLADDRPIIVSEAEFCPVIVRPGESTVFETYYRVIDSEHRHVPELRARLIVNADLAERFDLWAGELDVIAKEGASRWHRSSFETSKEEPPNQTTQRNAGSRPSSGDSSASETPSSPGPRG